MIKVISDVDISVPVHGHAKRKVKPSRTARAVGRADRTSQASQRGHHTGARHFPDRIVIGIRDVDISVGVHGHAIGLIKPSRTTHAVG